MKKSVFILLFLFTLPLYAEFKQVSISILPYIGKVNGSIEESVTYFNDENERTYLSRLDWDFSNLTVYGFEVNCTFLKYLNTGFTFSQNKPKLCGTMEDRDWQNPIKTYWFDDDPKELTNFSSHDLIVNKYSKLNVFFGVLIPIFDFLTINPMISFTDEYIKMTGSNGYYSYKFLSECGNNTGDQITYEQLLDSFNFAFNFQTEIIPYTIINFGFSIGPTCCIEAYDNHLQKGAYFNDKLYDAKLFEFNGKLLFTFNKHFGIGISGFYQFIPNNYGPDWSLNGSSWTQCTEDVYSKNKIIYGGSNRKIYSFGLSGLYRF